MRRTSVFLALGLMLGVVPTVHGGLVLYSTGFEAPEFAANQLLVGQGGFVAYGGVNSDAARVVENVWETGNQGVEILGADVGPYNPDFHGVFLYPPLGVDLTASGHHILRASIDIQLLLSPDDPSDISTGLQLYDGDGNYVTGVGLNGTGAYGDNQTLDQVFSTLDVTTRRSLAFEANYASRMLRFFVDDMMFGELAMTGTFTSVVGDVDITVSATSPMSGRILLDNYQVVSAVPEPSSLALAVCGVIAAGFLRVSRRRSRQ